MKIMKEKRYKIEYEVDEETGQISATIPKLNHISSFGDTYEEAEAMVKEAAEGYLEWIEKEKFESINPPMVKTDGRYLTILSSKFS